MKIISTKKEVVEIGDIITYGDHEGEFIVTPGDGTIILLNLVSFKRVVLNESQLNKYFNDGTIQLLIKYKNIVISSE